MSRSENKTRTVDTRGEAASRTMTGARALIASLEREGVTCVFGYPGGQILDIYDALHDSKSIHHVLVRHEQGATHMADGYARACGKPGVVFATSGPGATNCVTGIATAYMDSVPLIVITGQVNTDVIGTDAFQESDITGITLPIVKHSFLVKSACDLPRIVAEAFHIATTGRHGPVLIDIPADIAAEELEFSFPSKVDLPSYKPTVRGHARQIKQAAKLIEKASRPVLYVGGGVVASGAEAQVKRLATQMGMPVIVTLMGKGCFPENHRLNLGLAGMHGAVYTNRAFSESDLIVAVGVRFAQRVTGKISDFAEGAKVIHIDIDPAEIDKNRVADVPVVGDAKTVLGQLIDQLKSDGAQKRSAAWLKTIAAWKRECPLPRDTSSTHITPAALIEGLNERIAKDDVIFTTEVGQHQMWAGQYLHVGGSRRFLSSGGLGTMGYGFPAALGAQLACPDARVICLAGDGSFQMNVQEMATAVQEGLPVKVVLFDNATLGMVRQWQEFFYDGRYEATLLLAEPDFCALAQAYGWKAQRVDKPARLGRALDTLLSCKGPALLDVVIPTDELVLPMVAPGASAEDAFTARPTQTDKE